ncbi:MAG: TonB-dependent receptor [Acidobacteria bacterium]|nr:TonB-dependent receptor [Acidobacteriota bacterium]
MRQLRLAVAISAIVLFAWLPKVAAQTTGSVVGTVVDASGAVVPRVSVVLTNVATNLTQKAISSDTGDFTFPLVPVGQYTITAEQSGFQKTEIRNVSVALGEATRTDIRLGVAGTKEEVEVQSQVATVQTQSGSVEGVVEKASVVNLPLNGRNFVELVALEPNSIPSPHTSFFRNLGGYNVVAGAPVSATAVTVDGVNIRDINDPRVNIALNPDVVQEFQENQSNYSAQMGMAGGAQVNLVTKSGTNTFHGSAFEFLRNDKFDAKNYFDTKQPPFRQNQFGGSIGGPIIKNKTFFFAGYEGLRIVQHETFLYTVPTEAERAGNFTGEPQIFDPSTYNPATGLRQPFPNNQIPLSRMSQTSLNALALFPHPNLPGDSNNLSGNPRNNSTNDQFSVRIDHKIGENDSLFGRYIYYNYRRVTGIFTSLPNFADNFNTPSQNAAIGYIHLFGPSTVNQFRVAYHRMTQVLQDVQINVPINQQLGITGTSTTFFGNPDISIAGLGSTGGISNAPNNRSDNGYYLYDDLTHTLGKHELGIGFNVAFEQVNGGINSFARGFFSFTNDYTAQLGNAATGSAVADFLLGYPSFSERGLGIGFRHFRQRRYGTYINDNWRATRNLTVNLGLRWEYFQPGYEKDNQLSGFDTSTGQIVVAGTNGFPRGLRDSHFRDFEPRIGLAYQINNKTVVRGGYGLNFMPLTVFPTPFLNLLNEPFFTFQSFNGAPIFPNLTLANAFPAGLGTASTSLYSVDRHFKDPYIQQWNLAVQRELVSNLTVTLGYMGNHGSRLRNVQAINSPPPGPGDIQSRRPWPAFTNITSYENIGVSNYQSGYLKAEKHFVGGLGFLLSYTWAKLLDTGGIVDPGDLDDTLGRDPRNPNAEYGRDFFDARHRLAGSWVWEVPVGRGHRMGGSWPGFLQQTIGNWQLNGILSIQTGLPITPVLGFDNSNTGNFYDRPDTIGNPNNGPKTVTEWFNTSAFALPPPFTFGNTRRNTIDGPGIKTLDLSLFKNITLTERTSLQFRAEFFNSLNHPNFDPPGTTFGTPSFGVISGAADPRQIQFALKFLF